MEIQRKKTLKKCEPLVSLTSELWALSTSERLLKALKNTGESRRDERVGKIVVSQKLGPAPSRYKVYLDK